MELYVGGACQGKLQYVLLRHPGLTEEDVFDGAVFSGRDSVKEPSGMILNHFHLLVRNLNDEEIEKLLENKYRIIISDEVGSGVIPVDARERDYRERTGRWLCTLAASADRVERVICGIGQRIK